MALYQSAKEAQEAADLLKQKLIAMPKRGCQAQRQRLEDMCRDAQLQANVLYLMARGKPPDGAVRHSGKL